MDPETIGYLQLVLLVTDGIGIVASYQIAQYYNSGVKWTKFYKELLLHGRWTRCKSHEERRRLGFVLYAADRATTAELIEP
jgi:hypothetical protein